jgi:hypothetical protein
VIPLILSLNSFLFASDVSRAGEVAGIGEKRNAYSVLMGKPEGKRSLGRSRRRWADNIKMELRETAWGAMDWINLNQDKDQWTALVKT